MQEMRPIVHLITGLILAGFLMPYAGWKAVFVVIGSFLIDVDHYAYWIYDKKDLSLEKAYWWHVYDKGRDELHLFHTIEAWLLIIVLAVYIDIILLFAIGLFYHITLDFLEIHINRLYGRRSLSIAGWVARRLR